MTDEPEPKRPRGRPPKYQGAGKRQNFSFRIRDEIRERLIAICADTGRSISEEIEHRLEQSFERDRPVDPSTRMMGEAVTAMATYHQIALGELWTENPKVARYIFGRMVALLARRMGIEDPDDPDSGLSEQERRQARKIDKDAVEHDRKEADLGRPWPSADEGDGSGILVRLARAPIWPTALKTRYRS